MAQLQADLTLGYNGIFLEMILFLNKFSYKSIVKNMYHRLRSSATDCILATGNINVCLLSYVIIFGVWLNWLEVAEIISLIEKRQVLVTSYIFNENL